MIIHILYLSAIGVAPFVFGASEGGRKYRSLGRVNYSENSFRCPSEGFHADARDCRTFYRCVDWTSNDYFRDYSVPQLTAFRFECGEGTVFDPDFNVCNHAADTRRAECGGQNGQGGVPGQGGHQDQGGYPGFGSNPSESGFPNESENLVMPSKEEETNQVPSIAEECSSAGFFPVRGDCKKFIRCVENGKGGFTKYDFTCGPGTVWDSVNYVCNYPREVPGCEEAESGSSGQGSYPGVGGNEGVYPEQGGYPGPGSYPEQGGYPGQGTYPGSSGQPGQGGYPGPGGQPGQGGYPGPGGQPGQGGYPGSGVQSGQWGYPGHGSYPGSTGQPGQGGYPGPGGQPGQGGYPGSSGQPGQAGKPGPGWQPGQGSYPGSSGQPGQAGKPGPGGQPGQGSYPGSSGQPGQGGYPGSSGQPGQGGYPGSSGQPGQGSYPGSSGQPGQAGKPGPGGQPGQGGYPGSGVESGQWGYPGQGSYPGSSGQPGQAGKPGPGGQPGQGGYPGSNGQPGQAGKPGQWGYPGQGGYPGSGGHPGPGGQPGPTEWPGQGVYPGEEGADKKPDGNEPGGIFSGKCNAPGFYGVPGNCRKFIRCVDNGNGGFTKFEFECGAGTAWDIQLNTCNHASLVEGCGNQTPSGGTEQGYPGQEKNPNSEEKPSQGGFPSQGSVPGPGGYPSQGQRPGRPGQGYPSPGEMPEQSGYPASIPSGYPDKDNANPESMKPPPGSQTQRPQTTLNQNTNKGPNQFSTSRPIDGGFTQPMTPQTKPTSENPPSETSSPGEDPSKPPPGSFPCDKNQEPSLIKCEKGGFYPHPFDCTKFYRCVAWGDNKFSVYYFECGKGTIWDPALETCNYEKSVYPPRNCNNLSTQGTTKEPASTIMSSTLPPSTPATTDESTSNTNPAQSTPDSQSTTEMPTSQTSSTDATDATTSDQTESTISSTDASTEATESTTSIPSSSEATESTNLTPSSTDSTETSTRPEGTSEITSSPTEESTDSSTMSQTDSTTSSEPTEPTESTTSHEMTTESSGGRDPNCPQLDDDQFAFVCPTGFRRHPKNCNLFYQCTTSKDSGDINVMILSCKNDTIYDERKIQCLPPGETDSCQNQGQGRRVYRRVEEEFSSVVYVSPYKRLCPKEGSFPYEGDCKRFYKCKQDKKGKIQGYLYQCPEDYSFDATTERCEKTSALPQCTRSIPEMTSKSVKWMKLKVPVEYFNMAFR